MDSKGKSQPMTDEERLQLAAKLDAEFDAFLEEQMKNAKEKKPDSRSVEEIWEEMKQHPAFMTEFDPSKPMSEAMEGIQALKYEGDDDDVNAESYKEDGNNQFKLSKYRWAIDNYSAGLRCKSKSRQLNAILHSNRAAAHFRIGNYRSALNDCVFAVKFQPDHMKAVLKGTQCCLELKKYKDAIGWCNIGLKINPEEEKLLEYRSKAEKLKKQQERDLRKEQAKERKEQAEEEALIETIKSRGVTLAGLGSVKDSKLKNPLLLSSLETHHPSGAKVHLDSQGVLQWPVLFLYPEYGQSDFIESFCENASFADHIEHMFGSERESPPWDAEHKYKPSYVEIYYEDRETEKLHHVQKNDSLLSVLQRTSFKVQGGTPGFVLLVKGSDFAKEFLARYKLES